ncbi:MAG: redoxin domain-containing protein [Steroidobacteraceae bacterium]
MLQPLLKRTAIGITCILAAATAWASPEIGAPAPTFSATDAKGKPVDLASFKGKTVVLEWTNHECPFVKKHYESGNMPELQKEAVDQGVVWLQVISSAPGQQGYVDGPTALKLNSDRSAAPSEVLLDPEGKVGKLYGAQTTPHIFIIDAKGQLVYKGGIDSIASNKKEDIAKAENYVSTSLAAIASGKKIANPSTKPYGCSVKYAG